MKRYLYVFLACACLFSGNRAYAQVQDIPMIDIGMLSTTHILFTTDLTYVDISRPDVIAFKVVSASKNMLAIKAKSEFDFVTTISALETNGTMHTMKVRYDPFPNKLLVDMRPNAQEGSVINTQIRPEEQQTPTPVESKKGKEKDYNPGSVGAGIAVSRGSSGFRKQDAPTLEEVMRKEQQIFHIGDKNFNIEIYCTNIFVYSDVTYIVLTLFNNTDIGFDAGDAQFNIENAKNNKKVLATDKSVWAKSSYGSLSCAPRSSAQIGYTIPKLTLLKDECLKIYIYEKSGNRNLILNLSEKDINYAVSPK